MKRRDFLGSFALTTIGATLIAREAMAAGVLSPRSPDGQGTKSPALPTMTCYKSPSCGCCKDWVTYAQKSGFTVKTVDMDDLTQVKRDAGIPGSLESCHTVLVGAYVLEGHVPADLVKKMLAEKPAIIGLAVPGMVVGSPGMEQGSRKDPYSVIAFAKGGKTSIYARR